MSRPESNENDALVAIRAILRRYDSYCGRLNVPGNWGERAFRGWLMTDLLMGAQGGQGYSHLPLELPFLCIRSSPSILTE